MAVHGSSKLRFPWIFYGVPDSWEVGLQQSDPSVIDIAYKVCASLRSQGEGLVVKGGACR
jgi:hypothetical protein